MTRGFFFLFLSDQGLSLSILSLLNNWRRRRAERDVFSAQLPWERPDWRVCETHQRPAKQNLSSISCQKCHQRLEDFYLIWNIVPGGGEGNAFKKRPTQPNVDRICGAWKITGGMPRILNTNSRMSDAIWLTGMNLKENKYFAFEKTESWRSFTVVRVSVRTVSERLQEQRHPEIVIGFISILKVWYNKDFSFTKCWPHMRKLFSITATASYGHMAFKERDERDAKGTCILTASPQKWLPSLPHGPLERTGHNSPV